MSGSLYGSDVVGMLLVRVDPLVHTASPARILFGSPRRRKGPIHPPKYVKAEDGARDIALVDEKNSFKMIDAEMEVARVSCMDKGNQTAATDFRTPVVDAGTEMMGSGPNVTHSTQTLPYQKSSPTRRGRSTDRRDIATSPMRNPDTSIAVEGINDGNTVKKTRGRSLERSGKSIRDIATSPLRDIYYSDILLHETRQQRAKSAVPAPQASVPVFPRLETSPPRGMPDLISWSPPPRASSPKQKPLRDVLLDVRNTEVKLQGNSGISEPADDDSEELFDIRWLQHKRTAHTHSRESGSWNRAPSVHDWKDGRVFAATSKTTSNSKHVPGFENVKGRFESAKDKSPSIAIDYKTTREDLERLMRIYRN